MVRSDHPARYHEGGGPETGPSLALSIKGGLLTDERVAPMSSAFEFSLVVNRALGRVVVHVQGELDGRAAPALKERLADIVDGQGNRQVVLDLRRMTGIDFAGLLVLVDAVLGIRERGGELVLSGPRPGVSEQLEAAGLAEVAVITPEWTHPARGRTGARRAWENDGSR